MPACSKSAAGLKAGLKRAQDLVARYGGEEFVCLIPSATILQPRPRRELRAAVAALGIAHADSPTASCVTLSIGVAVVQPSSANTPEALIAAADAALYEAKRNGRNRVSVSADL